MALEWINIVIYLSVIGCVTSNLICGIVVYRRDPSSWEHRFFLIFLVGIAGYVFFYLFLQYPELKDFSYVFQLVFASLAIYGLFLFYFTLAHEGKKNTLIILLTTAALLIPPILNIVLHPYTFIKETYGFELAIESWYLAMISTIYLFFAIYALFGLLWIRLRTENKILKRKLDYIFLGLLISTIFGILFFAIIPIFLNVHYLKPIGYAFLALGVIVMTLAFKQQFSY
ncbi:MAG: histidine kinase N-terminal 7TM domain-containing protein [Candidatus Helarchaeota archaeon]